jgi:hypothetical protein
MKKDDWPPLTKNHTKEKVQAYRKAYPEDQRSNMEILECIKKIEKDGRHQRIMLHWAVSQGGFSEEELHEGVLKEK